MRKLALVLVAFVTGCGGGSSTVSTSSTPPTGGTGVGTPTPGGAGSGGMPGGGGGAGGGGTGTPGGGGGGGGGSGGAGGGGGGSGGAGGGGGGAACTQTAPTPVVSNLKGVSHLEVDDRDVYYLDVGPTALWRAPKAGGAPEVIDPYLGTVNDDVWAWDYDVDATTIYVMHYGSAGMSLSPGGVELVDKTLANRRYVTATEPAGDCHTPLLIQLVVQAGDVYWIQANGYRTSSTPCSSVPNTVVRLPAGSSTPQPIATTDISPQQFLADASHLFFGTMAGLWRMPLAGGPEERLFSSAGVGAVATGGDVLFFSVSAQIDVLTAPNVVHKIFDNPAGTLIFDGTHLYIATGNGLYRTLPDGSDVTQLAPDNVHGVAVDDQYVYYGDGTATRIMRTCK